MFTFEENKNAVEEVEVMLTTATNILNKRIAETEHSRGDIDRETLRAIRNKNIETVTLIIEMKMKEMI